MATSNINKTEPFNNVERITAFPYTPTHSGIAQILVIKNDSAVGWVVRDVNISGSNGQNINIRATFYSSYDGATYTFPVVKGVTYTISSGAGYVALSDWRSCLVY